MFESLMTWKSLVWCSNLRERSNKQRVVGNWSASSIIMADIRVWEPERGFGGVQDILGSMNGPLLIFTFNLPRLTRCSRRPCLALRKGFCHRPQVKRLREAKHKNKSNIQQSKFNHAGDVSRVSSFRLAAPWERRIPCSVNANHFRFESQRVPNQNPLRSQAASEWCFNKSTDRGNLMRHQIAVLVFKIKTTGSLIIIRRKKTEFARLYFSRNIAAY